ncbi:hypothetical protein O4O00_19670 [Citrobacter sedlakii]|uniref:hypothetical protein n=1 Tax=Citrobacter sedlakii TaxID=67826 RepID=UPI0022B2F108|nr:hypothetical protein [Citrobacter sedlakii]MCZ4676581.1 hypothetical protein [Citrobacter sedlakii]MDR5006638.1 hypothetical protein [Citrobacter sedlakii]
MSNIDKQALEEKTREAFERWAEQSGALPWGILKKHRNQDGSYPGSHYTYMWHAWNACHEALLDELDSANGYASAYEAEKWHYHGLAESEGERADRAEKQVEELTMWVKRLAHSLRNARPDSKLHGAAMDYLSRNGLISVEDVLR